MKLLVDENEVLGDMAIKDLTPQSTNIGDRIVKNMRICGSGIYTYARNEASLLHLAPVPEKFKDLDYINVFRPPEVLTKYKDYFARVPIITGHHVRVDRDNAKALAVGMVGDTVDFEVDKDDGETYLYTTGTIIAGDGVDAYERYGQLSVGYDPVIEWEEGVHKGAPYQAVLKGFNDVNHLLICKVARGGPQCMVMDSLDELSSLERFIYRNQNGGENMDIFKKIFGSAKPRMAGDAVEVSTLLQSIAVGADPKIQVEKVRKLVGDSDTTFNEYLDELMMAGDEKPEVVAKAVDIVDAYYKEHMAGDAEEKPAPKEEKAEGDEVKPEVEEKKEEGGDAKPCNGDELRSMIKEVLTEVLAEKEPAPVNGDEVQEPEQEIDMPLAGDSSSESHSSDDFLKDIWG